MQQAIPYKSWLPLYTNTKHPQVSCLTSRMNHNGNSSSSSSSVVAEETREISKMVSDNPVIVFARQGCCMSYVVKRLLLGLGVNPAMYEIEDTEDEVNSVVRQLEGLENKGGDDVADLGMKRVQLPGVFIGGKLFGGLDRLMATHISGELVPLLKDAGALWL